MSFQAIETNEPNFADWLGHILSYHAITQEKIAEITGASASAVSMWMNNNRLPTRVEHRIKLAKYLSAVLHLEYKETINNILWTIHVSQWRNSQ